MGSLDLFIKSLYIYIYIFTFSRSVFWEATLLLFCHFQYLQNTIPKIRLSQELHIQVIGIMTGLSARTLISPCQRHSTYAPYT
jgi:hypothetical protein